MGIFPKKRLARSWPHEQVWTPRFVTYCTSSMPCSHNRIRQGYPTPVPIEHVTFRGNATCYLPLHRSVLVSEFNAITSQFAACLGTGMSAQAHILCFRRPTSESAKRGTAAFLIRRALDGSVSCSMRSQPAEDFLCPTNAGTLGTEQQLGALVLFCAQDLKKRFELRRTPEALVKPLCSLFCSHPGNLPQEHQDKALCRCLRGSNRRIAPSTGHIQA